MLEFEKKFFAKRLNDRNRQYDQALNSCSLSFEVLALVARTLVEKLCYAECCVCVCAVCVCVCVRARTRARARICAFACVCVLKAPIYVNLFFAEVCRERTMNILMYMWHKLLLRVNAFVRIKTIVRNEQSLKLEWKIFDQLLFTV